MGIFDRSKSVTNTTLVDQTNTLTEQTDQSGDGSLKFSGIGGALTLDASTNVNDSRSSSISHSGNTVLSDSGAIAAGRDVGLGGLSLAGETLSTVQRVNADSLELLAGLVDKSIDASRTATRDAAESTKGFLSQAVAGFGSLAQASSEGDADKITRVVGFALLAVAVVVIGPALLRGGAKGVIA